MELDNIIDQNRKLQVGNYGNKDFTKIFPDVSGNKSKKSLIHRIRNHPQYDSWKLMTIMASIIIFVISIMAFFPKIMTLFGAEV